MDKYTTQRIENKNEWERFVLSQVPQSFLQSWNWGETNREMGNRIFRLGFMDGEKLVAVAQVIEERARRGPYFLIPGGTLLDWKNKSLAAFILEELKKLARQEKVWFIRTRPELLDLLENKKLFSSLGFVSAPMHLSAENTWVLDITPEEEQLLASMRKTTRYLIRRSLDKDLSVEIYDDAKHVNMLSKLQEETVSRHKFVGFSEKLFKAQMDSFGQDRQASLFICRKGKEALSAAIIIFYGEFAYYHHSGSTSKYKELPFSYFLQWNIIKEAKKRGLKKYNFWGIAPNDSPKHRFAGVTIFKKGFGGGRIDWLHAQDLPVSPFYWLTFSFETMRRIMRRL